MAKKKQSFTLDDFGFDNSLDMPDFSFNAPKIKDDRSATTKIAKGVIGGMRERAVSPSFIRNVIKGSLPRGYGSAIDMADETAGTLKSLYNDAAVEIKPVIKDLKRVTKRVMPTVQAALPRSMAAKVKKWSESDRDHKALSAEAQREAGLQLQMSEIFQFQTKEQARKDAESEARESIKDGIDHSRHRDMLGQLDAMRVSLQQLTSYQSKVDSNYQRKSLELQFRHYFVAMDALTEQKRQNTVVTANLEGILKNTGLPDYVKLRTTENLKQVMRNKFLESVNDTMFGKRRDFVRNLTSKLVGSAKEKIRNTASDFASGLSAADMALDARDMQAEFGGSRSGLETAGGFAGGLITDSLGRRAGKKVRGYLNKNETLVRGGNKAQLFVDNAPQMMMDYARSSKHETGGVFDGLVRGLKDAILATGTTDATLTEGSLDSAGSMLEPQPQTRGANKALTEIIPGFLARIYRELKIIRTGDDKQQLVSYDYTSNTFNDKNTVAKNVFKSIVKDSDREQTRSQIDELINKVDPQGTLSADQRKILGQHMLRDNMKMGSGTRNRLSNSDTFMVGKAGRYASTYANLFGDYFANDKDGGKELGFAREYGRLGQNINDSRKTIQDHANTGNREHLEAAGLLDRNGQRINMDKLYDYFYGEDFDPTNPTASRRRRPAAMAGAGGRGTGGLPPLPPSAAGPDLTPPSNPSVQVSSNAELIKAIRDSSGKTALSTLNDTVLRIEKRLNDGIEMHVGNGGGSGPARRGRWWNRSVGDLAGGLYDTGANALGKASRFASGAFSDIFSRGSSLISSGMSIGRGLAGKAIDRARGLKDVYIKGEMGPRLLAAKMKLGQYRDQATGKVITAYKDIQGAVIDEAGNVVLKAEEIRDSFIRDGVVDKAMSAFGALKNTAQALGESAMASAGLFYKGAFDLGKKAFGLLSQAQDVYVRGNPNPVLLSRIMKAGGYRSRKTGKVINHPGDIDGPVVDNENNVVLSAEELKGGILDKYGKPIRVGMEKLLGMASDLAGAGLKKLSALASWAGNKIKGGVDNVGSFLTNFMKHGITFVGGKTMVDRLTEIRDLLRDRLPRRKKTVIGDSDGDGERDGSYEDMMSKRKSVAAQETAAGGATPQQAAAGGGGIMGGLKGLYNKLRGKGEDGEGSDINILGGGGGKGPGVPKPKGPGFGETKGVWNKTKWLAKGAGRGLLTAGKWGLSAAGALTGLSGLGLGGLVAGAGSAIVGAGGAILSGLGALATGIGAVLSAPVVLGALAIAAVGAAGYYGYKYLTKKRLNSLSKIRYAQYGFLPADEDHLQAVFGLEDQLKGAISYDKSGAHIDDKKVDIKKMLSSFDIDPEKEPRAVDNWLGWFANRFKPVFLTHLTALHAIDPKLGLDDVGDLSGPQKKQYLTLVKFPEGPYNVAISPFPKMDSLQAGSSDVKALIDTAEAEISKLPDAKGSPTGIDISKPAATAAAAAGVVASTQTAPKLSSGQISELTKQTEGASGLSDSRGVISLVGIPAAQNKFAAGRIPALAALRYKTYGLKELSLDKVRTLDALEEAILKDLTWAKGNTAGWKGSLERLVLTMGPSFGVEGISNDNATAWMAWFNLRFLPVFLKFMTSIATATNKQDPAAAVAALKPQQAVDVAMEVYTTQSSYSGRSVSVWQVPASPWPGYEMNSEVTSVDGNMQSLKEAAKQATLDEQTAKTGTDIGSKQTSPASKTAKPTTAISTTFWGKTTQAVSDAAGSIKDSFTGLFGPSKSAPSMGGGAAITQPGNGTGGDINSLPMPTGNKSYQAMKALIDAAAKMVGVDPKLMATMAAIESGFDYTVKAPSSNALGLYQFIPSTWNDMLKKYGSKYGIAPNTPPTDPRANALMGAEFLKENAAALKTATNRPLTNTDLYLAHFLGAGGAKQLLAADPSAIAANMMPKAAAANPNIFFDSNRRAKTVAEVYDSLNTLVATKGKQYGISDGSEALVTAPSGATPPPAAPATSNNPIGSFPVMDQAPSITNATPAPSITAPSAATPGPSVPAVDPGVAAMSAGFNAPRSRDQLAQNAYQKDMASELIGNMVTAQQSSNVIQQASLEVLKSIAGMLAQKLGTPGTGYAGSVATAGATPASNGTNTIPMGPRSVPTAPVSMAKPNM